MLSSRCALLRNLVKRRCLFTLGDSISLDETEIMVKEAALAFSEQKLLPFANQWDEESYFPVEVFKGRQIFKVK